MSVKSDLHVEILKSLRRDFSIPTEGRNAPHVGTIKGKGIRERIAGK